MKKFILGLLILSTLLSLTIICNATLIADQLIDIPAEEEIMPMMYTGCSTNVPGIGWVGSPAWNAAVAKVKEGGHIQGFGSSGDVYPNKAHAIMLIEAAGLTVYGDVEQDDGCHNYPHIHYWLNNSRHNSIRVSK